MLLVTLATFAGLAAAQGCPPLELIYARATTEPKGLGAAGKHLASSLKKLMPLSSAYAVNYPASFNLNGGGCQGAKDMVRRIEERARSCPGIKFALGGHSQGGAVTTAAIPLIPSQHLARIVAVTMFGSPPCRDVPQVAGRCKSFCNKGDNICDPSAGGNGGPRVKCAGGGLGGKGSDKLGGKFGKGKGLMAVVAMTETAVNTTAAEGVDYVDDAFVRAILQNGCGEEERGHRAVGQAHMAYNRNGYYVEAAACYIVKKFKAAGSGGRVAMMER